MHAYKCITAYEGTRYNGWQKQKNTSNTIQEKLEEILSRLLDTPVEIAGSGRTDAGVHALGQVFHFHVEQDLLADRTSAQFLKELNHYLPKDIRVLTMEECSLRFHSRLNAVSKTYQYRIDTSAYGNLFLRNTTHHIPTPIQIEDMKKGAAYLLGTHDYKSFCSNKRMKKSTVRTITSIDIAYDPAQELLTLTYSGNGFLYNMVRILSGTLIEIGLGMRDAEELPSILTGCNRGLAGHTAPAQGLFLMHVDY